MQQGAAGLGDGTIGHYSNCSPTTSAATAAAASLQLISTF